MKNCKENGDDDKDKKTIKKRMPEEGRKTLLGAAIVSFLERASPELLQMDLKQTAEKMIAETVDRAQKCIDELIG